MAAFFESLIAQRDLPCPRCHYNLRGLRGAVCPECGDPVGPWLLEPPVENWTSRRFRAGRAAAGLACAAGVTILLFEVPRAKWRYTNVEVLEVALTGLGSLALGILWLFFSRRIARAKPAQQGRIASVMWALLTIMIITAMGIR